MSADSADLSQLLLTQRPLEGSEVERLYRLVEAELRKIGAGLLRRESAAQSLQVTLLVDDAFLRLVGDGRQVAYECREHFYRAAARAIRNLLIDKHRGRDADKRADGRRRVPLDERHGADGERRTLAELDAALEKLAALHPRQANVVRLVRLEGFTQREAAERLGVSLATVKNDWDAARAFLLMELSPDGNDA